MPPASGASLNSASRAMAACSSGWLGIWAGSLRLRHDQAAGRLAGDPAVPHSAAPDHGPHDAGMEGAADEGAVAVAVLQILGAEGSGVAWVDQGQIRIGAHFQPALARQ